jgi:antitoxin ChpS
LTSFDLTDINPVQLYALVVSANLEKILLVYNFLFYYNKTYYSVGGNMLQTLRRAGGSLVMTVPKAFIEQNHLQEGSQVELSLEGNRMTIDAPTKKRYKLEDLMAEMPAGQLPMVEGWDELTPVGQETF